MGTELATELMAGLSSKSTQDIGNLELRETTLFDISNIQGKLRLLNIGMAKSSFTKIFIFIMQFNWSA